MLGERAAVGWIYRQDETGGLGETSLPLLGLSKRSRRTRSYSDGSLGFGRGQVGKNELSPSFRLAELSADKSTVVPHF